VRAPWTLLGVALAGAAGCLFPDVSSFEPSAEGGADGADDTPAAACDPAEPFTTITPIAELDGTGNDFKPTLSSDELEIWYGYASGTTLHVMHAQRTDRASAFGSAFVETAIDSLLPTDPALSPDGRTLFFAARGATASFSLYEATRANASADFGAGSPIALETTGEQTSPFAAADGSLYFANDTGSGAADIYVAAPADGGFATPALVGSLSSTSNDEAVVLTDDGLWAYVTSDRTDLPNSGASDVFLAHRASTVDGFGPLANASDLNTSAYDRASWLSPDRCRLYLESNRDSDGGGPTHVFVASKTP